MSSVQGVTGERNGGAGQEADCGDNGYCKTDQSFGGAHRKDKSVKGSDRRDSRYSNS